VVAPKSSESNRVQMTSAAKAVIPDSAITTYTLAEPAARATRGGADSTAV
jgi:hypothetical protein